MCAPIWARNTLEYKSGSFRRGWEPNGAFPTYVVTLNTPNNTIYLLTLSLRFYCSVIFSFCEDWHEFWFQQKTASRRFVIFLALTYPPLWTFHSLSLKIVSFPPSILPPCLFFPCSSYCSALARSTYTLANYTSPVFREVLEHGHKKHRVSFRQPWCVYITTCHAL